MTSETNRNPGHSGNAFQLPFVDESFAKNIMNGANVLSGAWLSWQEELARFAGKRWQADLEVPQALTKCHDLPEVMQVQQKWLDEAVRDYSSEAGRMFDIALQVNRDCLSLENASHYQVSVSQGLCDLARVADRRGGV